MKTERRRKKETYSFGAGSRRVSSGVILTFHKKEKRSSINKIKKKKIINDRERKGGVTFDGTRAVDRREARNIVGEWKICDSREQKSKRFEDQRIVDNNYLDHWKITRNVDLENRRSTNSVD